MQNSVKLAMDFVFLSLCCPFFFPPLSFQDSPFLFPLTSIPLLSPLLLMVIDRI